MVLAVTGHGQLHSGSQAQQAWKPARIPAPDVTLKSFLQPESNQLPLLKQQFFILSYTVQHILESTEFAYHGPDVYPMRPKEQKC